MDEKLNYIWKKIRKDSNDVERNMSSAHRKQTGSYYTSLDLSYEMMKELINFIQENESIVGKTFLEPCVGTGNFVFSYLRVCYELSLSKDDYQKIIDGIFVCDINENALKIYKENLKEFALKILGIQIKDEFFKTHIGKGLLVNINENVPHYIPIENVFNKKIAKKGFDIIATNPPYKNLRAESKHYSSKKEKAQDKLKYARIAEIGKKYFPFSDYGTLNLYKMFVEEIIERYSSKNGYCSLLIPLSILSDKNCSKLRGRILNDYSLKSIHVIPENSNYADSSQALCSLLISKNGTTSKIKINGSLSSEKEFDGYIDINDIVKSSNNNSILLLSVNERKTKEIMEKNPRIKDIESIKNLRGELDITFNKNSIVKEATNFKFYRGKNIGFYKTVDLKETEYVLPSFVNGCPKSIYISKERLACQQIANMAKEKRIAFTIVPKNSVLGNSCNFISINDNKVDIYFLLGVLNSKLVEWYFNLTSSNNHINNYEIDNIPIPVDCKNKKLISSLSKKYIETQEKSLLAKIEKEVRKAYKVEKNVQLSINKFNIFKNESALESRFKDDLQTIIGNVSDSTIKNLLQEKMLINSVDGYAEASKDIFNKKVLDNIVYKYQSIKNGKIINHTDFKLSQLDLEMMKNVPQGGSWKDIPMETVKKSKRLLRITKTGGRTTLYGRIDYNKPSYTITTYFNRPGNGTYVHPVHQRVISVREAARFQCFPDEYYFYGSKTDMLKQVGNAVPTILAYNIGKSLIEKLGVKTSVDLFSGAGGMTYGFKRAGISAVIATDIVENACITLKTNNPEINVLCGDITADEIKEKIIKAGIDANADVICGGPPCQGFSLAGFRNEKDPRNLLFKPFIEIVSKVNPKVVVFENVEGIISYQGGKTYREVLSLFSELGYNAEGRKLLASQYGVPQRRKRVIILCVRKDLNINPSDIFPKFITPNFDKQVTAYETIHDLEEVPCSDDAKYFSSYTSPVIKMLKGEILIDEYLKEIYDNRGLLNNIDIDE